MLTTETSPPIHHQGRPLPTDTELLECWVAGDRRAGDRLIGRYYEEISRYFARRVRDQDARELTQETFAQLCRSARLALTKGTPFRPYLRGIAFNTFNLHLRHKYLRNGAESSCRHPASSPDVSPLSVLMRVHEHCALVESIGALSEATRQLLIDYYWRERTARELGTELDIPAATVRTRLWTARKRLHAAVTTRDNEPTWGNTAEQLTAIEDLIVHGPQLAPRPSSTDS